MEKIARMATPSTNPTLHRLILLVTLLGATYFMAHHAEVTFSGQSGVTPRLPDHVGAWTGEDLFFCQTMTCQWTYTRGELGSATNCIRCEGRLSPGSPVEWALLPGDTEIIKKLYRRGDEVPLVAAIVLSGADRTSIHRPQICLVGGGQEIVASHQREVLLAHGGHTDLVVLDLLRRGRAENGQMQSMERFFSYWFVGPDRVTASHWARMFWMGFERIFKGVSHRWAYISISGSRTANSSAHLEALDEFVRDFYPQVVKATPPTDATAETPANP